MSPRGYLGFTLALGVVALAALRAGEGKQRRDAGRPAAIVVTQVPAGHAPSPRTPRHALDRRYPPGSRIVRLDPGLRGEPRLLSGSLAAAGAPRVSADGRTVVFAGRPAAAAPWAIYTVRIDGSGLRAVAGPAADCGDPAFLAHGELVFACNSPGKGPGERDSQLFVARADGRIEAITFGPRPAFDPTPLVDGRILFTRGEPGAGSGAGLFTINPDGTQLGPFVRAAAGERNQGPRQILGGAVIFLASGAPDAWSIERVELRFPEGLRRSLAAGTEAAFVPSSVEPLASGGVLIAGARPGRGHGIFLLGPGENGPLEPRFDDPGWEEVEAVDAAPTPELLPRGRPSSLRPGSATGTLLCYDVNRSERPLAPGNSGELVVTGEGGGELARTRIEADGSFAIEVPSDRPIRLSTLDARAAPIATCDWIWVRPGEVHACFGCHESPSSAPVNRPIAALARLAAVPPARGEKR